MSTTTDRTGTTDPTGPPAAPPPPPRAGAPSTSSSRRRSAVAFGVVFWAWGNLWNAVQPAFTGFPPGQGFMYGVWLMPGVLGALVIRKRGAAVYVELVASIVSALLGTSWGLYVVAYGLVAGRGRGDRVRLRAVRPGGCRTAAARRCRWPVPRPR